MKLTKHIEEAKVLLEEAIAALADQDAKIQALPEDVSDEERSFHEGLFQARQDDVNRRRKALERLIAIEEAKERVPPVGDEAAQVDPNVKHTLRMAGALNRLNIKESLVYS